MKVTVTGAIGSSPKRKEEKEEEKGACIHTYIHLEKKGREKGSSRWIRREIYIHGECSTFFWTIRFLEVVKMQEARRVVGGERFLQFPLTH